MKSKPYFLLALLIGSLFAAGGRASAQGSLFTYQGRLNTNGTAFNGSVDLRFKLFSDQAGNNQVGSTFLTNNVAISGGLFTVGVDFGAGIFTGSNYFLQVGVSSDGGVSFTDLSPLQPVTPAPYSIMANSASNLLGTLPTTQLNGTVANTQLANNSVTVSAGTGLSGGGAIPLGGTTTLNNAGVLSVTGNADITANTSSGAVTLGDTGTSLATPNTLVKRDATGSFSATNLTLGGTLSLPVITAGNPVVIGSANSLMLYEDISQNLYAGGGGLENTGGSDNAAFGAGALQFNVGNYNTAMGANAMNDSTDGNNNNTAIGTEALLEAGGLIGSFQIGTASNNIALGAFAGLHLEAGNNNIYIGSDAASSENDIIRIGTPGVQTNTIIAGLINGNGGGLSNLNATTLSGSATLSNLTLQGTLSLPAITAGNPTVIGSANSPMLYEDISENFYAGGGGLDNTGGSDNAAFGAGALQFNVGNYNTAIGANAMNDSADGNNNNTAIGTEALLEAGGLIGSFQIGTASNNIALGAFAGLHLEAGNNNIYIGSDAASSENDIIRIGTPGVQTNTIIAGLINGNGGGLTNLNATNLAGTLPAISGVNLTSLNAANVSSGTLNDARLSANIARLNTAQTFTAMNQFTNGFNVNTGAGVLEITNDSGITPGIISGVGFIRVRNALQIFPNVTGTTAGSLDVRNTSGNATVSLAGGTGAITATNLTLTTGLNVDQGNFNVGTSTDLSFGSASGEGIGSVRVSGSNDSFGLNFYTDFTKRMTITQVGNVGIGTSNPTNLLQVGSSVSPAYCNGTSWVNGSDRNAKQDFTTVDSTEVLARVAALPITEWQYKAEQKGMRHLGPMAQDFHAAFGLNGNDDTHISTVDESGVALAAIQGLNQKLDAKDAEIAALKQENQVMEQKLDALQTLVQTALKQP